MPIVDSKRLPAKIEGMNEPIANPFGEGAELPPLTVTVIDELKSKGFTQSDIARMYGVTRQAVSWHKKMYNGHHTPRETVLANFPWKVSSLQGRCSAFRRLRDHGEYVATGGKGMSDEKLSRLRGFYKTIREENVVLEYDPDIPPIDGFASEGGFRWVKRTKRDGDLLIRVNKYTDMSDEGRMIWRLPPVDP